MSESIMNPHLFNVHIEKLKEDYRIYSNIARPFGSGTEEVVEYHIELTCDSVEILLTGIGILYAIRQFDPEQMDNQEELSLKIKVIDQVLFPQKYIPVICGYISLAKDLKTILGLHQYKWNPETAKKWTNEALNGLNNKFYITASHFENTDTVSINFADELDTRAKLYSTNNPYGISENECNELLELQESSRRMAELRGIAAQREVHEKKLKAQRKAYEEKMMRKWMSGGRDS